MKDSIYVFSIPKISHFESLQDFWIVCESAYSHSSVAGAVFKIAWPQAPKRGSDQSPMWTMPIWFGFFGVLLSIPYFCGTRDLEPAVRISSFPFRERLRLPCCGVNDDQCNCYFCVSFWCYLIEPWPGGSFELTVFFLSFLCLCLWGFFFCRFVPSLPEVSILSTRYGQLSRTGCILR